MGKSFLEQPTPPASLKRDLRTALDNEMCFLGRSSRSVLMPPPQNTPILDRSPPTTVPLDCGTLHPTPFPSVFGTKFHLFVYFSYTYVML